MSAWARAWRLIFRNMRIWTYNEKAIYYSTYWTTTRMPQLLYPKRIMHYHAFSCFKYKANIWLICNYYRTATITIPLYKSYSPTSKGGYWLRRRPVAKSWKVIALTWFSATPLVCLHSKQTQHSCSWVRQFLFWSFFGGEEVSDKLIEMNEHPLPILFVRIL